MISRSVWTTKQYSMPQTQKYTAKEKFKNYIEAKKKAQQIKAFTTKSWQPEFDSQDS